MISESTDQANFLDQLVAGDRQAFAVLVDQTSSRIYNLGLRMLGNEQDAEDILQETYLKAYKALPGFEKRSSLNTWLFRIATNEALMLLRKRKKLLVNAEKEDYLEERDDGLEIVDWCCLPENELVSKETKVILQKAADRLTPSLKTVFQLRDVQGFSGQETAEILGIQENAVKTRLVRARLKLRNEISAYFRERMESGVVG